MVFQPSWSAGRRLMACFAAVCMSGAAIAQDSLSQTSIEAQQAQAELQQRIDAADDSTQESLNQLRQAERQADRLDQYNAELAPLLDSQAERIASQQQALAQLSDTREALPGEMREMVEQLRRVIEADMPFLREERLARVADLDSMLGRDDLGANAKLERIFSAWRMELDYGRGLDEWSGALVGDRAQALEESGQFAREVDFLRVGRVGWYYLTPDDTAGGVWSVADAQWQPLEAGDIDEVRRGIRTARDQSAPALLTLPTSLRVDDASADTESNS